jgi:tRNA(fMet)-specific endonuclease VapC
MICLDRNAAMALINRSSQSVRIRMAAAIERQEQVTLPVISLFELRFGASKSRNAPRAAARLAEFLSGPLTVLPFEQDDAEEAGGIRAYLESLGTPIGPYDVLIAAQARRRDAILVTSNTREFIRVPRLKVEDWTAAS